VFELLAISRWEHAGRPKKFSLKQLFKDVLTQLVNHSRIDVAWEEYYSRRNYSSACHKEANK